MSEEVNIQQVKEDVPLNEEVNLQQMKEEELIQKEFEGLLEDYRNSNHRQKVEIITKAFNFAKTAHKG
ncbi:MAG TPA: hypothetical protein PLQ60_08460, partial [Paludibacteraceae bacterium]|nr:hypothetical protein [Victivallales bacterium]HPQ13483.1 hypothetical protein [Paludibacteraceae bacterium]